MQSVAALFPVVPLHLPAGQEIQSDILVLSVFGEYLPTGQSTHALATLSLFPVAPVLPAAKLAAMLASLLPY